LLGSLANHAALLLPENINAVADLIKNSLNYIRERQKNDENIQLKYENPYNCGKMIVSILRLFNEKIL
jgi:hypothetical protein